MLNEIGAAASGSMSSSGDWERLVMRLPISTGNSGLFNYAEGGRIANVLPVFDDLDNHIDNVAWFDEKPAKWWLERGVAKLLGEGVISKAEHFGEIVTLVGTPAEWIGAGPYSVCVLEFEYDLAHLLSGDFTLRGRHTLLGTIKRQVARRALSRLPTLEATD